MDIHKNARLTPHGRAELVRRIASEGQPPTTTAAHGKNRFPGDEIERLG